MARPSATSRQPSSTDEPEHPLDRHGVEVLSRDDCVRRLRQQSVARVAVTFDAMPVIVPVNFVLAELDDEHGLEVVIRTVEGTKLQAALRHAVVAVEVDHIEPASHLGWSVLVRGRSRVITDAAAIEAARQLRLRPWATEDADRFIGVSVDLVSGREVVPWHASRHADGSR
jgi:nitroimidazol reductase NimA-like FMN-containing flavoprotein (pyridoxamine 5'-phosphate oxidase superfamily)